jgi:hypothetical protein
MTVLRRAIQKLGPYQSLALLLVPVTLVEPLKLVALVVAGEGHWLTGTAMIVGAYAVSLLFVERLFRVVKPKLMTLSWFAKLWTQWMALRNKLSPWSSVPVDGSKTGWFHLRHHVSPSPRVPTLMIADIQFPDCCGADPTSPLISGNVHQRLDSVWLIWVTT